MHKSKSDELIQLFNEENLSQEKFIKLFSKSERKISLSDYAETVDNIYTSIFSVNLSDNTFDTVQSNSWLKKSIPATGSFNSLINNLATFIPSDNQRSSFLSIFSESALFEAYNSKKKYVNFKHKFYCENDTVHFINTIVYFLSSSTKDNIKIIIVSRFCDNDEDLDEATRLNIQLIKTLAKQYAVVFLSNADSGAILYSFDDNTVGKADINKRKYLHDENAHSEAIHNLHKLIIHPDDLPSFSERVSKEYVLKTFEKTDFFSIKYRMLLEDTYRYFKTTCSKCPDYDKTHNYVVGINDIDDEVRLEQQKQLELEKALKTAKDASEIKHLFMQNLSHNLKTPINVILGMLNMAMSDDDKTTRNQKLSKAEDAANELLNTINDLFISLQDSKKENSTFQTSTESDNHATEKELIGKRILIVDDVELNIQISQFILLDKGMEVETAHDGLEALEKIKNADSNYYDFILMDIQMPNMNGHEATKAIRALSDKKKANIPIIALSAYNFPEDKQKSFECGMNEHLGKPVKPDVLTETLCKFIK